ncbi:MAG: hypothetical protein H8D23_11805 [Candidatus Brocadiales bacterium]|nr:hypothetical protein [Candidatus Brocadiales bacterium]
MKVLYPNNRTAYAFNVLEKSLHYLDGNACDPDEAFQALDVLAGEIRRLTQILRETKKMLLTLEEKMYE